MKSLLAQHFLKEFAKTNAISKYSPKASEIAEQAKGSYPKADGGFYEILAGHIIDAAIELGIPTGSIKGSEIRIGVSAQQFNSRQTKTIFSSSLICIHGFVPLKFGFDEIDQFLVEIPRCPKCENGLVAPSAADVEAAVRWLRTGQSNQAIGAGALILAGRQLGLAAIKKLSGSFQIRKTNRGDKL